MPKFDPAVCIGPWKGGHQAGVTLSYLHAAKLQTPLKIHPLLECKTWDPKPYGKYISWNVVELPEYACIYVDYDESPTALDPRWDMTDQQKRFQPATSPKVEELHLLHVDTGWSIRIANRLGVNITDVLQGIFEFFASPLYVDELGEMHPRAVRVMEQQFFEKRTQGFHDDFKGYRKSDALLGMTYYNGLSDESEVVMRRLNYRAANVLVLKLGNC